MFTSIMSAYLARSNSPHGTEASVVLMFFALLADSVLFGQIIYRIAN